jgi:hypothetical protein
MFNVLCDMAITILPEMPFSHILPGDQMALLYLSYWLTSRQSSSVPDLFLLTGFCPRNLIIANPQSAFLRCKVLPVSCWLHHPRMSFPRTWETIVWNVLIKEDKASISLSQWGNKILTLLATLLQDVKSCPVMKIYLLCYSDKGN